ncbi:hypothetical protein ACA910_009451 [Epithemia clementina (nom. ined.)]
MILQQRIRNQGLARHYILLLASWMMCACWIPEVRSQPSVSPVSLPTTSTPVLVVEPPSAPPTVANVTTTTESPTFASTDTPTITPSNRPTNATETGEVPSLSPSPSAPLVDEDGDGFPAPDDCDDTDASIHQDQPEICGDGKDNNCNGEVDESPCLADDDLDGAFVVQCDDDTTPAACSNFTDLFEPTISVDCNDTDADISPFAEEICDDGIDNDCDGSDSTCPPSPMPSGIPSILVETEPPSAMPSVSLAPSPGTASPSALPSISAFPTDSPSATVSVSVAPSSIPSGSEEPSQSPSETASSEPSPEPIVLNATLAPSESFVPSDMPSNIPSDMPSNMPSVIPSATPSVVPVAPSSPPSLEPTELLVLVSQTFKGVSITLVGIRFQLTAQGIATFQQAMEVAIVSYYERPSSSTRLRRYLQAQGTVSDVTATVDVVSQESLVTEGEPKVRIIFDPTIEYKIPSSSRATIKAEDVVMEPFADSYTTGQLTTELKKSHPDFTTMSSVSTVSIPPGSAITQEPSNEDDSGLGLGVYIGIGVAGAAVLAALFIAVKLNRRNSEKVARHDPLAGTIDHQLRNELYSVGEEVSMVSDNHTYDDMKSAGGRGDQSIETIDYDYSKAYGGGEQSVVSSAGGTLGDNTRETGSHIMATNNRLSGRAALGASFDSETGNNSAAHEPIIQEQTIEISAPPGKLGVVIDTPNQGAPVVHAVKDSSVIANLISVGDQLIMVDDIDVSDMTAIKVSKLISKRSANPQRKLTVVRKVVLDPGEAP